MSARYVITKVIYEGDSVIVFIRDTETGDERSCYMNAEQYFLAGKEDI